MTAESGRAPTPLERGHALLAARRYAQGWPLYEERRRDGASPMPQPIASQPEWRGEPIAGKTIVVCAEQGWGDQLMFARYLGALKERGAEIVVACHHTVIGSVFYFAGYAVTPFFIDRPLHGGDYWVPIGSLPYLLGCAFPPPPVWAKTKFVGGGGVGVVASGNPRHRNDAHRSLRGEDAAQLLRLGRDLLPLASAGQDMNAMAHTMGGLDLVVTVDTAAAHLAGSTGVRCWVLLPFEGLDWRWNDGVRSDWYPEMRLFRQPRPGDWASVLSEVAAALAAEGLR